MKLKKIVLACAAALTLPVMAHAAALTNADFAGATTIYLSGASAPDSFLSSIATSMFDAGYKTMSDTGSIPGPGYTAFLGTTQAAFGAMPAHTKVLLIKRSKGGSVWGVNPVARNEPIATLAADATHCSGTASPYTCTATGVDNIGQVPYIPTGTEMIPDFGASDVAPFMFKAAGINVEVGAVQLSSSEAARLDSFPVQAVGMGIVATNSVPDTTYISQAEYGSMLTGTITDWTSVGASPAGGTQVVVCRRVPGSGTQASYNWSFNNFPCAAVSEVSGVSGNTTPTRMTDSAGYGAFSVGLGDGSSAANAIGVDVSSGYTVIENQGSGDVRNCLKAAELGTDYTFLDENNLYHKANFSVNGGHYGAIGVLSLDSQEKTANGAESAWWFRPIDGAGVFHYATQSCTSGAGVATGVCPSNQNLLQGRYSFSVESTMQYRNSASGHAIDSVKQGFADEFIKRAGAETYQKNWTTALPLATNGLTATVVGNAVTNKVARGTHNGNMCAPFAKSI